MSLPVIEPVTSRSSKRTLYQLSYRGRFVKADLLEFEFCLLSRQKIAYSIRNFEIGTYYL